MLFNKYNKQNMYIIRHIGSSRDVIDKSPKIGTERVMCFGVCVCVSYVCGQ